MTIRWRWVSREEFDDAIDAKNRAESSAAQWQSAARQWEGLLNLSDERHAVRYNELLSRYHMLKLQGFSEPAPPVARPVVAPDPIKRAIAQRAGTNRQLRESMERAVAQDRLMGQTDEQILNAILTGVSGEDLILSEAGLMSP